MMPIGEFIRQGLLGPSQLLGDQGDLLGHCFLTRGMNVVRPAAELGCVFGGIFFS
jgi:hypothetical protein